jgi:lipid-A-disaccharide synthase
VGNPTADEVRQFLSGYHETAEAFCRSCDLDDRPIIALLAGSREQEIKDNLPAMLKATRNLKDYQMVIAGAPSIEDGYYRKFLQGFSVKVVRNQTYPLLSHATAALVTSGTATLETALFGVPQVVCYETPVPHLIRFAFNHVIQCKYISLVNLIADEEIVPELLADRFTVENIQRELGRILPGQEGRTRMMAAYDTVIQKLGDAVAPDNAAAIMIDLLNRKAQERNSCKE